MSSTLQRTLELRLEGGPAVVIGGDGAVVECFSARDLPAIGAHASGVVVDTRQEPDLVRAVAGLGLPVIVRRAPETTPEEWLGVAKVCAGNGQVILCEGEALDLTLVRSVGDRPVFIDVSGNIGMAPAAIAAGAAGLLLAPDASAADVLAAREAVTLIGPLVRPERPTTLAECRGAIDRVDAGLATLLEQRAALAGIVQTLKPVGGFAGRDMDRERQLVASMARRAPQLGEVRLAPIMNAIIEAGLHLAEESKNG